MGLSPELEAKIKRWAVDPVCFVHDAMRWDADKGSGVAPLRLESYQEEFMRCTARYRAVNKSRQTGYSFTLAVEATTRSILDPGHNTAMVSYNAEESKNKIAYIHKLVELSPALSALAEFDLLKNVVRIRPKWSRRWSKIVSLPCRPVRGFTKLDLLLDEVAFYENAEDVYLGSVPATVRAGAGGQVTLASTPNGKSGVFWDVVGGAKAHTYWQQQINWWESRYLCLDPDKAREEAPFLGTEERVLKYGRPNLVELYSGMTEVDFQQEFECQFIDSGTSYFPYDLIEPNQIEGQGIGDSLQYALENRSEGGTLFVGVDIGRHKDTTEIVIVDRAPCPDASTGWSYTPLSVITLDRWSTQLQGDELERIMKRPEIQHIWIDCTGIGWPIYERLREANSRKVSGVVFTLQTKEHMATLTRRALERNLLDLPDTDHSDHKMLRRTKEFIDHLHSIKRIATTGKHSKYEAESTQHHGDRAWALMLSMLCSFPDLRPKRGSISEDVDIA